MAGCSDAGCNCVIQSGDGITITGAGTPASPYLVASALAISQSFQVNDTDSVNLSLVGGGNPSDPLILTATATVRLTQLADVADPQGGPAVGDVPVWVGSGALGHFEFQPPPANPAGSVNVGAGLSGTGAINNPLVPALVGTNVGGPTSGLEVYVDSAGNLRALSQSGTGVAWGDITGKPLTFPPSQHNHSIGQITDISQASVANATKVAGHNVFVQSTAPTTGMVAGDLWFF